ncbi:hypothetical protein AB0I69_39715 [Streptomyces sp. NPDC050508]|uniref:hypothetical protein n=1 Tax=Streptomyces sp. NPDC050508 TaxID=3155405 RepID=UPI0034259DE3
MAVVAGPREFEPNVIDLLVETLRRAVRHELSTVGTDTHCWARSSSGTPTPARASVG